MRSNTTQFLLMLVASGCLKQDAPAEEDEPDNLAYDTVWPLGL